MNVLFVYRIIVSEFCRIGKWGNDRWMGGRNFGINFEFVEFFGGWLEDFVGEVENWEIWRGFGGEREDLGLLYLIYLVEFVVFSCWLRIKFVC